MESSTLTENSTDKAQDGQLSIPVGKGTLSVSTTCEEGSALITFSLKGHPSCTLHWGLCRRAGSTWKCPPEKFFPKATKAADGGKAAETVIKKDEPTIIRLEEKMALSLLAFVVYEAERSSWIKDGDRDFEIQLPSECVDIVSPADILRSDLREGEEISEISLASDCSLAWILHREEDSLTLLLATDIEAPVTLHWGLAPKFRNQWKCPDKKVMPEGSAAFDDKAARTPFSLVDGGGARLELTIHKDADGGPKGINFLIYQPDKDKWIKTDEGDIFLRLFDGEESHPFEGGAARDISEEIIAAETGYNSWTLMHRFNLCHDLIGTAGDSEEAWALLFVWLRYSAVRQLDWQRNYNTQPRDLAHSQDRLTIALARAWKERSEGRRWIRMMLSTLGRGGDGQIVRDEILNIMHRHHLKEVRGSFMEEWHQKLHNNTTPDDVVICEAYLAFMKSGGNTGEFYRVLEEGGVTRERLAGFERPIVTDPVFHGDKCGGLIPDFENYLSILKRVHSGADFDAAADQASHCLGDELGGAIREVQHLKYCDANPWDQVRALTRSRGLLSERLRAENDDGALRNLLYLDLGVEMLLRTVIERVASEAHSRDALVEAVGLTLENAIISTKDSEFSLCLRHWEKIKGLPRDNREWALHAKSISDRIGLRLAGRTSTFYDVLQPKAEYLGAAFDAEDWVISLFSEEIIRGGELFVLSLLLRHLDKILREAAGIGGWQIISPGEGRGRLQVVESLYSVQTTSFSEATVLLADRVSGDEEIPEGITSVITSDCPDLVSHVAVRARNTRVLLAACFDEEVYNSLRELADKQLILSVTGDSLTIEESSGEAEAASAGPVKINTDAVKPRSFTSWAVTSEEFNREIVGGKSNNLTALRGKLSDSIHLPVSAAIPFGACEKVLAMDENREVESRLKELEAGLNESPADNSRMMREAVMGLTAPDELRKALEDVFASSGLPKLTWDETWTAVKRVWAAKWNERAVLSRRSLGLDHDRLMMAVLIQEIVPADYAFVIHTVNPITGDKEEIYAEVVAGMGETLVGNYPGRSLSFTFRKDTGEIRLLSYPGKSEGIYASGVIFRSDSNGEDLEGFAGAGLYDSYPASDPEHRLIDYTDEPLVWDEGFRTDLLKRIAEAAREVESACSSPQDIEGAFAGNKLYIVQTRAQVGL